MRVSAMLPIVALLSLGACQNRHDADASADRDAGGGNATGFSMNVSDDDGTVATTGNGSGIAVNAPGFSGNLKIPGLQLGGDHMDIDGMKPFPGTTFGSVNVDAHDSAGGEDRGEVKMGFSAPAIPADVLAYYATAARKVGYTTAGVSGDTVTGTKPNGSRFTVSASPAGSGTTGTLIVSDRDKS